MLIKHADTPEIKRVFSEFNASLFGSTAPTLPSNTIAQDGDYDFQVDQFTAELFACEDVVDEMDSLTLDGPLDNFPVPQPPVQSEQRVSISVTSHVSAHAIASSSQVSSVVSSVALPTDEHGDEEIFPLPNGPKVSAPKRKGAKSSKKTKAASEPGVAEATIAPAPSKTAKKTTPVDPPTRALRVRSKRD